jgi:6-phosphogluconate dehydrogenase
MKSLCDIGFIGLGVMGSNLALNLVDNGYAVACFDLNSEKVKQLEAKDKFERGDNTQRIFGTISLAELLASLTKPSLLMISIPAGDAVEQVCDQLIDAGIKTYDIVIDTGNSLWTDTIEREARYKAKFIFFTTAVSGGEVGARFGPSLMPSGDADAWPSVAPVLQAIAAKVDPNTGKPIERFEPGNPVTIGEPCAVYIGASGSGHYVKMVHNGIEYADMQMICECYDILRNGLGLGVEEIADVFEDWNTGV